MSEPVKHKPWDAKSLTMGLTFGVVFFEEKRLLPNNFDPEKLELIPFASPKNDESLKVRIDALSSRYVFPALENLEDEAVVSEHQLECSLNLKSNIDEPLKKMIGLIGRHPLDVHIVLLGQLRNVRCRKSLKSNKTQNCGLVAIQIQWGDVNPFYGFQWGYCFAHLKNPLCRCDYAHAYILAYPVSA